ncbi:MAG: hypothetical protein V7637_4422, partial [Mycobacteriales bacterium]
MSRFQYAVLGPLRVGGGGGPFVLSGKQQAVLGTLLLDANATVQVDRLVSAVWDTPPPSATANVQTYVSGLRRMLDQAVPAGGDRLRTEAHGYRIEAGPGELDLLNFDLLDVQGRLALDQGRLTEAAATLERAVGLWRGDPLERVPLSADAQAALAALRERRSATRSAWIDARLALGHHDILVGELRRLVQSDPLCERAWAQLMLALYRSGRRTDALEAYSRARAHLVGELGVEPTGQLRSLHIALLANDPALDLPLPRQPPAGRPVGVAGPGPAPIGCQLPPDLADFVGRAGTVAELAGTLRGPPGGDLVAPRVVAIFGRAGVGKSALACRLAHLVRPAFPDGQLYVELPPDGQAGDALGVVLLTLGVAPTAIPASMAGRGAVYRALLADRRVLILVDGATTESQVTPLLPGTGRCALVVTSRRRLTGLTLTRRVDLDPLDEAAAVELLGRVAGRRRVTADPEAARCIAAGCGRLPLALRIAGARLAARPDWPLRDLAGRLGDPGCRLGELAFGELAVRPGLAACVDALPAPARRALCRLSLLDAPAVGRWAVAALLDRPEAAADRVVEALVVASLLVPAGTDLVGLPRYRLPDLIG